MQWCQWKMSLTVSSVFLSATLPSPVGERVSITVSWGWSLQLIPAWLHYGALTVSDGVSDFHQIRLKLLLSASVPGALPDNERSAGNKMEHIFSSDAAKKKTSLLSSVYMKWPFGEVPRWRPLLGFAENGEKGEERHIPGSACQERPSYEGSQLTPLQ